MDLTFLSLLKLYLGMAGGTLGVLSFVTMSWIVRLRIVAVMGVGVFLLGFIGGPIVSPTVPLGAVTLYEVDVTFLQMVTCVILAFLAGLVGYFVAGSDGRAIGPVAVPAGLMVWAMRTGSMTSLMLTNHTLAERQAVYGAIRWEGLFWGALVLAGYFGVVMGSILPVGKNSTPGGFSPKINTNKVLSAVAAMVAAVIIGQLGVGMFAQDVKMFDSQLGTVIGQADTGQIGFAVIIAFGVAGFVAKKFLEVDHVFVAIATVVTAFVAITISSKPDILGHMVESWPVHFYPRAGGCILPLQYVAFGSLGAMAGYWSAVLVSGGQKNGGKG